MNTPNLSSNYALSILSPITNVQYLSHKITKIMDLETLAQKELDLLNHLQTFEGSTEEKNDMVVYFGIADAYEKIHKDYTLIADRNLEALKRAIFIIWYGIAEPACHSGIVILDEEAKSQTFEILNEIIEKGKLDFELKWMLYHYDRLDLLFQQIENYTHIKQFLLKQDKVNLPNKIDKEKMRQRGQMGHYWNSLNIFNP